MNKFANHLGYSDINPYEVVRVVSDKTIEVREMDAERDPTWTPEFIPGGFSAHCTNQHSQRWIITSNPENRVVRIRLSKNGFWKSADGRKFHLGDEPVRFYDYNF
jgi:hypothetical protein